MIVTDYWQNLVGRNVELYREPPGQCIPPICGTVVSVSQHEIVLAPDRRIDPKIISWVVVNPEAPHMSRYSALGRYAGEVVGHNVTCRTPWHVFEGVALECTDQEIVLTNGQRVPAGEIVSVMIDDYDEP